MRWKKPRSLLASDSLPLPGDLSGRVGDSPHANLFTRPMKRLIPLILDILGLLSLPLGLALGGLLAWILFRP